MSNQDMKQRIAYLEFVNDQLLSEIRYVDELLRLIGFPEGLETIKVAAQEVLEKEEEEKDDYEKTSISPFITKGCFFVMVSKLM